MPLRNVKVVRRVKYDNPNDKTNSEYDLEVPLTATTAVMVPGTDKTLDEVLEGIGETDLTGLATEAYVDNKVDDVQSDVDILGTSVGNISTQITAIQASAAVRMFSFTLEVASWVGSIAPYTQVLSIPDITIDDVISLSVPATTTVAQMKEIGKSMLVLTSQSTDSVTVCALDKKPTIALPIQVVSYGKV